MIGWDSIRSASVSRPSHQQPLRGFAQVGQEMPAIGNLLGAWDGSANGVAIGARAVTGNDFDGRMLPKPPRNDGRLSAAEHFDRSARLQINDDATVAMSASDGPVVDADDDRCRGRLRTPRAAQLPQHSVAAGNQPKAASKARGCSAAQGIAQRTQGIVQS